MRGQLRFTRKSETNPIVTPWATDTLSIIGSTTNPTKSTSPDFDTAYWRRVGRFMEVMSHYEATNATGAAAGSGTYLFGIPDGEQIDLTLIANLADPNIGMRRSICGVALVEGNDPTIGTQVAIGHVWVHDTDRVALFVGSGTVGGGIELVGSTNYPLNNVPVRYNFHARFPIDGWVD